MKRYYITDRKTAGGFGGLLAVIREQMHAGVEFIQIREKDATAREVFEFTRGVVEMRRAEFAAPFSSKIFVNTRSDIARASGADGVHLPEGAPQECLPGMSIGRSCHTVEQVREARADFVTFGPVFQSPGKGKPVGLEALAEACKQDKLVFALGGVDETNAAACVAAGAWGVAGIRLFQGREQLRQLRSAGMH